MAGLLRSQQPWIFEWPRWFAEAGIAVPPLKGPVFDSSLIMVEAALQGLGVALAPPAMFRRALEDGTLVQPFAAGPSSGGYWLTWLKSRQPAGGAQAFRAWLLDEVRAGG